MEFNLLQDLLNTKFTIIEVGLFYGGENLEAKIHRFQTFLDNIGDGHIFQGRRRVKTLQILVEFF